MRSTNVFELSEVTIKNIIDDAARQDINLSESLISVIVQLPEGEAALGTGYLNTGKDIEEFDIDSYQGYFKKPHTMCAIFLLAEGSSLHTVQVGSVRKSIKHNH